MVEMADRLEEKEVTRYVMVELQTIPVSLKDVALPGRMAHLFQVVPTNRSIRTLSVEEKGYFGHVNAFNRLPAVTDSWVTQWVSSGTEMVFEQESYANTR
jgi:hypothetical protein